MLTKPSIQMKPAFMQYSVNESYSPSWDPRIQKFIEDKKKDGDKPIPQRYFLLNNSNVLPRCFWISFLWFKDFRCYQNEYSFRYIGTFIADFHRTLMYGGIFLYPNNKASPNGKLRLLYECNPASFIMEVAGGMGTNGKENILDIQPTTIHDRTQVFLGAKEDIKELHRYLEKPLWD